MQNLVRFGRKMRMPSTLVIKHQLRMMTATDTLTEALQTAGHSKQELGTLVGSLIDRYGISFDRAHMLLDRMGVDRSHLKVA